jgi:hypothetical protein
MIHTSIQAITVEGANILTRSMITFGQVCITIIVIIILYLHTYLIRRLYIHDHLRPGPEPRTPQPDQDRQHHREGMYHNNSHNYTQLFIIIHNYTHTIIDTIIHNYTVFTHISHTTYDIRHTTYDAIYIYIRYIYDIHMRFRAGRRRQGLMYHNNSHNYTPYTVFTH